MNLFELLFPALLVVFVVYCCVSVVVTIYILFKKRDLDLHPMLKIKFLNSSFFVLGSTFALAVVSGLIFYKLLFFIPESWGNFDEERSWISTRESISGFLGFISSIFLMIRAENIIETKKWHEKEDPLWTNEAVSARMEKYREDVRKKHPRSMINFLDLSEDGHFIKKMQNYGLDKKDQQDEVYVFLKRNSK